MIAFYQEKNGDYLAIDTDTNAYYLTTFGHDTFQGRAAGIAGMVGSVCTTGVSRFYLKHNCKRVSKSQVPVEWLKAIGY